MGFMNMGCLFFGRLSIFIIIINFYLNRISLISIYGRVCFGKVVGQTLKNFPMKFNLKN